MILLAKRLEAGGGCLARLRATAPWASAQARVAEYILGNATTAVNQTIDEIAAACGVSTATVVRFCRTLGYEGFTQFRRALTIDILISPKDIHEDIKRDDPAPVLTEKVFNTAIQTLRDTLSVVDIESLEKAIRAVGGARMVEIYGVGGSGFVAQDTYHKFMTIGVPCIACTDSHIQAMSASLLSEKDVAIGISHSGATPETIRALRWATMRGATTICVTNYRNAPINKYADIQLFTASRETTSRGIPVASRIAQLIILDVLFVGVAVSHYERALESIYLTAEASRGMRKMPASVRRGGKK